MRIFYVFILCIFPVFSGPAQLTEFKNNDYVNTSFPKRISPLSSRNLHLESRVTSDRDYKSFQRLKIFTKGCALVSFSGGLTFIEGNTFSQEVWAPVIEPNVSSWSNLPYFVLFYTNVAAQTAITAPLYAGQLHDVVKHGWQLVRHPKRTLKALKETEAQHPYLLTALKGVTAFYAVYKGLQRGQLNYDAWKEVYCEPYDLQGAALAACNESLTASQMWPALAGYAPSSLAFAVSKLKLSYPAYEYAFTEVMRYARFRNPVEKKRTDLLDATNQYYRYIRALKAQDNTGEIQELHNAIFANNTQTSDDVLVNFKDALSLTQIPEYKSHWTRHATQTAGWLISALSIPAQYGIWQGMGHSGVMAGILTGLGYIPEATSTSFMLETFYEGITKRRYLMEDYGSAKLSLLSWGVGTFLALPFFVDGWVSTTVDQTTPFMMVSLASYLISNGAIYGEVVRDQYKKISRSEIFQKATGAVKNFFTRLFCCKKPDHRKITLETERKKVKAMRQEILDKLRNEVTRIRTLKDSLLEKLYNAFTGGKEMQDVAQDPESPKPAENTYIPPTTPPVSSDSSPATSADSSPQFSALDDAQRDEDDSFSTLSDSPGGSPARPLEAEDIHRPSTSTSGGLDAPLLQRAEAPAEEPAGYAWYNPIGWGKKLVNMVSPSAQTTATAMPVM